MTCWDGRYRGKKKKKKVWHYYRVITHSYRGEFLFTLYRTFMLPISTGQILSLYTTSGFFSPMCLTAISPSSEQISAKDPHVRVQQVRGQEGIVPRPFSQLHPLRPVPGCGLHHLRVHEASPAPELTAILILPARSPSCGHPTAESTSLFSFFFLIVLKQGRNLPTFAQLNAAEDRLKWNWVDDRLPTRLSCFNFLLHFPRFATSERGGVGC